MTNGYTFCFDDGGDVLIFPITPGELSIKVGSKNKTVTLIDEGDVNILKSPSLIEVEFEARFPMRKYPYSRDVENFQTYYDKFSELKTKKRSFHFIVMRNSLGGRRSWETDLLVALEEFEFNESADEGDDVLVTFKLKQYKDYGVKTLSFGEYGIKRPTVNNNRSTGSKGTKSITYTVQSGDCLWNIAKAAYGDASKWKAIYETNKSAIEADAKKHGKKSSSNGHWIWPGLKLTIPNTDAANLTVQKLKNSK